MCELQTMNENREQRESRRLELLFIFVLGLKHTNNRVIQFIKVTCFVLAIIAIISL